MLTQIVITLAAAAVAAANLQLVEHAISPSVNCAGTNKAPTKGGSCKNTVFAKVVVGANTNLSGTDFTATTWEDAVFTETTLTKAKFASSTWKGSNTISESDFSSTGFNSATISSLTFVKGAVGDPVPNSIESAVFTSANIVNLTLTNAVATKAIFKSAAIEALAVFNSTAVQIDFTGAKIAIATFVNVEARRANFDGANVKLVATSIDLINATFENANMNGGIMSEFNLSGASFKGASLKTFSFGLTTSTGGDLSLVDFANANLSGATFMNADLNGANFKGADLTNVRFDNASLYGAMFDKTTVIKGTNFAKADTTNTIGLQELGVTVPSPTPSPNPSASTAPEPSFDETQLEGKGTFYTLELNTNLSVTVLVTSANSTSETTMSVIQTKNGMILIDTTGDAATAEAAVKLGETATQLNVTEVYLSSELPDKIGGVSYFAGRGIPVKALQPIFDRLANTTGITAIAPTNTTRDGKPDVDMEQHVTITVDGVEIELKEVVGALTPTAMIASVESTDKGRAKGKDQGVLLAGDALFSKVHYPVSRNLGKAIDLAKMVGEKEMVYLYSAGHGVPGGRSVHKEFAAYLQKAFEFATTLNNGTAYVDSMKAAFPDYGGLSLLEESAANMTFPLTPASPTASASPTSTDNGACFPADATVQVLGRGEVTMSSLRLGDMVRVGTDQFSPIFFFSHRVPAARNFRFVKIFVSESARRPLTLTANHYLYVNGVLAPARSVVPGDTVMSAEGALLTVSSVRSEVRGGLFNPHTLHGDVVVDGIVTSTYTESVAPGVGNVLLAPLRWAFNVGIRVPGWLDDDAPKWLVRSLPSGSMSLK